MAHGCQLRAIAVLALCGAGLGCETAAAVPPYTPYQGISIDSAALVAPYGCGTGPGQVYRYVVTLRYAPGPTGLFGFQKIGFVTFGAPGPVSTGVFDCFADAVFEGLPPPPASFVATVYAFSYAEGLDAGLACEAGACVPPVLDPGAPVSGFSWTTTCTATEEAGGSVVAQCDPLHAPAAAAAEAGAEVGDARADGEAGAQDGNAAEAGEAGAEAGDARADGGN